MTSETTKAAGTAATHQLLVLHMLRLGAFVPADKLAERIGLDAGTVRAVLAAARDEGLAKERSGRISGWMLTPAGKAADAGLLASELEAAGARAGIERLYTRFIPVNETFKQVCTRWQMRDMDAQVPNDHADAEYDAAVIAELGEVHRAALPLCHDLAGVLARFGRYSREFEAAWQRVSAGDRKAFAAPMSGSYHDLWMELHQDLLTTLGRDRSAADGQ